MFRLKLLDKIKNCYNFRRTIKAAKITNYMFDFLNLKIFHLKTF